MRLRPFAALTTFLLAGAALAQDVELVSAGATDQGTLSLDLASRHDHHGHGYQRVAGILELHEPYADPGRAVTRLELTQDWDCALRRVRTVQAVRRTWTGQRAGADLNREPWRPVAAWGGEARAFALICPAEAAALASPVARAAEPPPRRRSPAQVIDMPTSRR